MLPHTALRGMLSEGVDCELGPGCGSVSAWAYIGGGSGRVGGMVGPISAVLYVWMGEDTVNGSSKRVGRGGDQGCPRLQRRIAIGSEMQGHLGKEREGTLCCTEPRAARGPGGA